MVTRTLSEHNFGVWQNVGDVIGYLTIFSTVIPPWAMRYASRGFSGSAKTGLIVNLALSIPFTLSCILLSSFFAAVAKTTANFFRVGFHSSLSTASDPNSGTDSLREETPSHGL